MTNQEVAANIKLLICDVDGVLTDGKIYIGNDGELFKAFNVKDGLGIKMLLANQIDVAILTARSSKILEKRTQELGITNVLQGQRDKVAGLKVLSEKPALIRRIWLISVTIYPTTPLFKRWGYEPARVTPMTRLLNSAPSKVVLKVATVPFVNWLSSF